MGARSGSVLALLLLLATAGVARSEFIFEVGRLVQDRISQFLSGPIAILGVLHHYHADGLFSEKRDDFLRLNYPLMSTLLPDSIYYGREDGTFVGGWTTSDVRRRPAAMYREPGDSGYAIANVRGAGEAADKAMEKYYRACVNSTSGESLPCRMSVGEKYTECTMRVEKELGGVARHFDCELERCADDTSQRDCDVVKNDREKAKCRANTKWCSSYTIKEAPDDASLGYIPKSLSCIDRAGLPTQTPGEVVVGNHKEGGTCYYGDNVTPVKRSLKGDYAYCGGDGAVCSNTYDGAYASTNYDPRVRRQGIFVVINFYQLTFLIYCNCGVRHLLISILSVERVVHDHQGHTKTKLEPSIRVLGNVSDTTGFDPICVCRYLLMA